MTEARRSTYFFLSPLTTLGDAPAVCLHANLSAPAGEAVLPLPFNAIEERRFRYSATPMFEKCYHDTILP